MEEVKNEVETETFFGRCKCCLEYGYMKSMWLEHPFEGECEIYGEMIMETFSITSNKSEKEEHICESCIVRLRDAFYFKREVLASAQLLSKYEGNDSDYEVSKEEVCDTMPSEIEVEYLEDEDMEDIKPDYKELEYQEIEYLDEDEAVVTAEMTKTSTDAPVGRKWLKKKKKGDKNCYRDYTDTDLRLGVDAVLSDLMTPGEAAKMYNVPRRTISARVTYLKSKPDTPENVERMQFLQKQYRFVDEIKTILAYTNAVPFKVRKTRLVCAYCDPSPLFEEPEDLRAHTDENHEDQKIKDLELVLKPHWLNEVIRMDVENLACKECYVFIPTWNDMFQHLNEIHDVQLDEAYTRVIPYKLTSDYKCALCTTTFPHFHFLDSHMNAHYNNYVCAECGDTFVSECRLKKHVQIHSNGKFPCQECGKVFTLKKYMTKHVNFVHKQEKIFKCLYCDAKFSGEYERHTHVVEHHNEKVKVVTCEICGKTFNWRPYYLAHMRKKHNNDKKYKCEFCMKRFLAKHELRMHVMRHKGEGACECSFCGKRFVTKAELRSHLRTHYKNK
ncbi:uncharacterized protein ACR2FA_008336 [Aphomia sociella]